MNRIKPLLGPMRLPFLLLTPACVSLGIGTAVHAGVRVSAVDVVLVLVGAVSAHVSVNALNEYFDFRSGLDLRTRPTPFSGGSGTLPSQPALAPRALATGWISMALTGLVGVYFVWTRGWALLPLGLLGLALIAAYTLWLTHDPFLCLIAPGLGFGILMVMGTDFALTGFYSWSAFAASLIPFFLVSDLLLLNEFPDVEADRSVGRRHLPISLGRRAASLVYGAFLMLAYLSLAAGVALRLLPALSLLGLLTVPLAARAALTAYRHAEDIENLIPAMAQNVLVNLATPVLAALGLVLA
jgi:1,4-dihydroxy-2-naphthoate octaprenyltransferase